jgi:hypothetical protein
VTEHLKVFFPYKNYPAVYWDEMYCFSLPTIFQCRHIPPNCSGGPSRCTASSNGYLFYCSIANFNLVCYNIGKIRPTNAGGLAPSPITDTLNLQALVDLMPSSSEANTIYYLQPHQVGKIVFVKDTGVWKVADETETTIDGKIHLGGNRVLGTSKTGRILVGGREETKNRNYVALYNKEFVLVGDKPIYFEGAERIQKLLVFETQNIEFLLVLDHALHMHLCWMAEKGISVLKSINTGRNT